MIKIKDFNYQINGEQILSNINLTINDGDYIAIVGDNGSGKTTLFHFILGLKKITTGEIFIDNTKVEDYKAWEKIGYIAQKNIIKHDIPITVQEYLNLYAKDTKQKDQLIIKFQIQELLKKQYLKLSGGQAQRVNIVKALLKNPKYLILDEPNTGLDKEQRNKLYQMLHDLNKEGITIIIVTHNIEEIYDKLHKIYDIQKSELKEVDRDDCSYC
ncbi:MAG: metal ABC transporter ATP-binding protein [Mycoplasmatales bacterium]